ncbi:MAG: 16S rRNA (cytidine(1402)-2'-O)-methyltransferase [Chloroflexota bacterium]
MGTLFIVPTPIGNLEDITLRALRVLREVSLIAAEDTRTSRVLLSHYSINTPLTSYHEHNKLTKLDNVVAALATGDVALISDAGMPGISDPGYELVRATIDAGYRVEPLPGPNAILPALVGSGLPTDQFIYMGFVPRKAGARLAFLQALVDETRTVIAYESPNRLQDTLAAIRDVLGPARQVCVARELTKTFEEFTRGPVETVLQHYADNPPRGEITLLIAGQDRAALTWDTDAVRSALRARLDNGEGLSQAARAIAAESGWSKRDVYAMGIEENA